MLTDCLARVLTAFAWPKDVVAGQAIELPFAFTAPSGQNTIDRRLVPGVVKVLLDASNSGNAAASMIELALDPGSAKAPAIASRDEVIVFLDAGTLSGTPMHALDAAYVAKGHTYALAAGDAGSPTRVLIVAVPGGAETAARGGALPDEPVADKVRRKGPELHPRAKATRYPRTGGATTILIEQRTPRRVARDPRDGRRRHGADPRPRARDRAALPARPARGTMTIDGVDMAIGADHGRAGPARRAAQLHGRRGGDRDPALHAARPRAALQEDEMIDLAPILAGDIRAASRLMRDVDDRRPAALAALKALHPHTGRAYVLGVTGNPGAGKSTVVDSLIAHYRAQGDKVGVVAVDPTSPFTGGAILGDRIRMQRHALDDGVFIRSLATRGHLGGLSRSTFDVVAVLDAMGYQRVLVETVGVGQDEVEVMKAAHTTVVVTVPGLGDDIQAIKAGLLEIADVLCVNKSDREGADRTVRDLMHMLDLRPEGDRKGVEIINAIATKGLGAGSGILELAAAVERHRERAWTGAAGEARARARAAAQIARAGARAARRSRGAGVARAGRPRRGRGRRGGASAGSLHRRRIDPRVDLSH